MIQITSQTGTVMGPFWGSCDDIPIKSSEFLRGGFLEFLVFFLKFLDFRVFSKLQAESTQFRKIWTKGKEETSLIQMISQTGTFWGFYDKENLENK